MKAVTSPPKNLIGIIAFVLAIIGCTPPTTELANLPTPALLAFPGEIVDDDEAQLVANLNGLPPTFTPIANARNADSAGDVAQVGATNTPTPAPILPSRTPRPSATLPVNTPTITSTPTPTATPTNTPPPPIMAAQATTANQPPPRNFNPAPVAQVRAARLPSWLLNHHGSKLGVHVIQNNDPRIMEFVRQAHPAVMKGVDDLGFLEEVKQVSPGTITIGRFNDDHQSYAGNPEQAARDYVNGQLERYRKNPWIDYWEGWNEPDPGMGRMDWYARFEQERTRLMAGHGFKVAIGGFPTGVPELEEFRLFVPAIQTAINHQGILTLHEYGAPDLNSLYGGALPGKSAYPDRGLLSFRYRWYYREILEPAGLLIPLAVTEYGVDGTVLAGNRPGPNGYGWDDFQSYWVDKGYGATGAEAFLNQLAWYDQGTRQDKYVIGFTIFTAGGIGHWKNYEIGSLLPRLADYVNSQR